jgi:hypothetical protein
MTPLRLRGVPAALWISALIAAAPAGFVIFEITIKHAPLPPLFLLIALASATLPWLSRLAGRFSHRAAFDDVALHVAGEAVPWNMITRITEHRAWRRDVWVVERGRVVKVVLVTRDLFAGHLEPMAELRAHLATHGKVVE